MKQLAQLASDRESLEARGVAIVAVAPAAPSQATQLEPRLGFPLLLDPEHNLRRSIGQSSQSLLRFVFNVRAWLRYLWAFATHRRQGRFTGHYSNLPATVIVDGNGDVAWAHLGRGLGDHPSIKVVREQALALTQGGGA